MQAHESEQENDRAQRLAAFFAVPRSPSQQADNNEAKSGRKIAMDHLVNGFTEMMIRLRIDVPVTSRPIRAAETRIGKADPCTQHDHRRGERGAR